MRCIMVFKTDKKEYKVKFIRKNIKKTYLRITNDGEILITSKQNLNKNNIEKLLTNHRDWLNNKLDKLEKYSLKQDEFMIFGTIYKIKTDKTIDGNYKINGGIIYLKSKNVINFIYQDNLDIIKKRFYLLASEFNLSKEPQLQFRKMKSRWGVCHYGKWKVVLNKGLIHLPEELIDYIIYHELTHFYFPDHSKNFYKKLAEYCPNYKIVKKQLRNYAYLL